MNFEFFSKIMKNIISHVQHTIFISAGCPFHTLVIRVEIFQVSSLFNFLGLQRSIGQPKV